jgi:uncharacterized protein (TIGR02145 family)
MKMKNWLNIFFGVMIVLMGIKFCSNNNTESNNSIVPENLLNKELRQNSNWCEIFLTISSDMKFQRLQSNMRINITDYGIFDRDESERIHVKFEGKLNKDGTITMNRPYSYNFKENSREIYMLKRWKVSEDKSAIILFDSAFVEENALGMGKWQVQEKEFKIMEPCNGDSDFPKKYIKLNSELNPKYSIEIGSYTWMTKNLNVSSFANGDPIQEAKSTEEWIRLGASGKPAWCYYENDANNDWIYGKLYNWYAVSDPRGLAPNGWYIPSHDDWRVLVNDLGGNEGVGTKLKSKSDWYNNGRGDNTSGLNFMPTGIRNEKGEFDVKGTVTMLWSYDEFDKEDAWVRALSLENNKSFIEGSMLKQYGMSVRCMKYDN